ncbi:MAG: arsenite methyltransferase [Firmicutes bacterium]|jgi:ubiquinone/menaquinone biosynthesis C-methylase UbiE|nr:arsenite methyltransferase [Bacillota bacterium]
MTDDSGRVKKAIRQRYGTAALTVKTHAGMRASCCPGSSCCCGRSQIDLTGDAYTPEDLDQLPEKARLASLGCGNPTALAALKEGEIVLDLGSGGGIDVLLSAKRVGPTGKAYGLDMTDEMLALARENQLESGLDNVEFLKGDMEQIPLPDEHVDVIISNCVINLSPNKGRVFKEAWRVLKPGGRIAVTDIVFRGNKALIPDGVLQQMEQWTGCVAGALSEEEYHQRLQEAGFVNISVEVIRVYDRQVIEQWIGSGQWPQEGVQVTSAFVRAYKPKN